MVESAVWVEMPVSPEGYYCFPFLTPLSLFVDGVRSVSFVYFTGGALGGIGGGGAFFSFGLLIEYLFSY